MAEQLSVSWLQFHFPLLCLTTSKFLYIKINNETLNCPPLSKLGKCVSNLRIEIFSHVFMLDWYLAQPGTRLRAEGMHLKKLSIVLALVCAEPFSL